MSVTPEPRPRLRLSATVWDPEHPALDQDALVVVREQIRTVLAELTEMRTTMEDHGPGLGLFPRNATPTEWAGSAGSPTYYLRMAEGYLRIAGAGLMCRDDIPESPFTHLPPPQDNWVCDHDPEHHPRP